MNNQRYTPEFKDDVAQQGGLNEQVQHLIDQVRYRYDSLLPPPYR
ncbi:hypothetical protein [Halomonas sp. YLB-10]|nr:hypothetical protein [Halomonas sp. YLB-10]